MSAPPIRVGIVGIGFAQHVHVPAFRADGRAAVTAICASTEARARAVADKLGIARALGDWRALVRDPEIDAVSIGVPAALQAEVVIEAARAGKHVFCEKPLANDAAAAARAAAAVRAAGVVGAVDFEFREIPAWRRAKQIWDSGELGRLRQAAVTWRIETYAHANAQRDGARPSWKLRAEDGGGALNLFGSHSLYYVEWLLGRVRRLAARLRPEGAPGDAGFDVWMELEDGGGAVSLSVAADAFLGCGHLVEIYGDGGTLALENRTSDYVSGFSLRRGTRATGKLEDVDVSAVDAGVDAALAAHADGRVRAVGGLVRRFLGAIAGGERDGLPGLDDGHRVQVLMDAIRQSDRSRTWQPT